MYVVPLRKTYVLDCGRAVLRQIHARIARLELSLYVVPSVAVSRALAIRIALSLFRMSTGFSRDAEYYHTLDIVCLMIVARKVLRKRQKECQSSAKCRKTVAVVKRRWCFGKATPRVDIARECTILIVLVFRAEKERDRGIPRGERRSSQEDLSW